jgi:DNA-binding PadR family transcriptional regulator
MVPIGINEVVARIREQHGRVAKKDTLAKKASKLFGPKNMHALSEEQVQLLIKSISLYRLGLTQEKVKEIVAKVDNALRQNINLTPEQAQKVAGLEEGQFRVIMRKNGGSFKRRRHEARVRAIHELDLRTGKNLTIDELALRLNLDREVVRNYYARDRGKGSTAKVRDAKTGLGMLRWIGLFTSPESKATSVLPHSQLMKISLVSSPVHAYGAIDYLKKNKLIFELDTKNGGLFFRPTPGEKYYWISPKGQAYLNSTGKNGARNGFSSLPTEQLEKMLEQLTVLQSTQGVRVPAHLKEVVERVVGQRRIEEYQRKSKPFDPKNPVLH